MNDETHNALLYVNERYGDRGLDFTSLHEIAEALDILVKEKGESLEAARCVAAAWPMVREALLKLRRNQLKMGRGVT